MSKKKINGDNNDSTDYPKKNKRVVRNPDPLIVGQSQHVIGKSNHILGPSLSEWK